MVKVSIEVRSGAARFRVAVQAQSIQRAARLVGDSYPASDLAVVFPIDPEDFFVKDALAAEGLVQKGTAQEQKVEVAA